MNRHAPFRMNRAASVLSTCIASLLGAFGPSRPAAAVCAPNGYFQDTGQDLNGPDGSSSTDVAVGDVDGNGYPDALIAATTGTGATSVWINQGKANFQPATFVRTQSDLGAGVIQGVALGDLDGDGDLDAFLVGSSGQVWLNQGIKQGGELGRFASSGQAMGVGGQGVALGDLDGDGDLDAVTVNAFFGGAVWLNDGNGQFNGNGQGFLGGRRVALGDLDRDGKVDAFIANHAGHSAVWKNRGVDPADGKVKFEAMFPTQPDQTPFVANAVALGDLDRDGDLDAVLARSFGKSSVVLDNRSTTAEIVFGPGAVLGSGGDSGVAVERTILHPADPAPNLWIFFADDRGSNAVFLSDQTYYNGSWHDRTEATVCLDKNNAEIGGSVAAADLDMDGDTDAIVVGSVNRVWLKTGSSPPPVTPEYHSTPFLPGETIDLGVVSSTVRSRRTQNLWPEGRKADGSDLTIYVPNIVGATAPIFSLEWKSIGERRPYAEVSCESVGTAEAGTYTATLEVESDEPSLPVVTYPLSCTVVAGHPFTESLAVLLSRGPQPAVAQSLAATSTAAPLAAAEAAAVTCSDSAGFSLNPSAARKLTVEIPPEFGGGSIEMNDFDGSVNVSLLEIPGVIDRCGVRIGGGTFTAPSVNLPSRLPTGPNTLRFGPASQSGGEFDIATGAFTATAMGTIVNDLFPNGVPIAGSYSGTYDPASGNLSVQSRTLDFVGDVPPPAGTLAPPTFDFPATQVGTPSVPQMFTVTATSVVGLRIDGAALGDTASFSIASNNCPAMLPLNQNCALGIVFAPATVGSFNTSLTVNTNAGPLVAALSGNGIAPPPQFLPATVAYRPLTWNLKREGHWLTAYIELPDGHDPANIDLASVRITAIDGNPITPISARTRPTEVGDFDRDGIRDRMVKFSAEALRRVLGQGHRAVEVRHCEIESRDREREEWRHREIELQGRVAGQVFIGRGIVKVIAPGKHCGKTKQGG